MKKSRPTQAIIASRTATVSSLPRYEWIDSLRGAAILLMIAYHFCFDLNQFGIMHQSFNESSFWLSARAVIVTMFLTLAGISLALAQAQPQRRYWIRLLKLAACATLVTIGSAFMFPRSYIFFGILHFIFVASLLGKGFLRLYYFNLIIGWFIVFIGIFYSDEVFNQPLLQWIGLMSYKPITEDYVPLLPWFGIVLIGIFIGQWMPNQAWFKSLNSIKLSDKSAILAWMGKRSLLIYMLHQPILLAILWLVLN